MISTISKKTISEKARLLQKESTLNYTQALHNASQQFGFKNYDQFKASKKFNIAVYSQKGGVGKTPISRNLAIDLNSDKYIRVDYRVSMQDKNFIQIFPKIKEYDKGIPKTDLSVVYDLCTYTKFDKINNILEDIDLYIIPTRAHECSEGWNRTIINSIYKIYKYNKPIIILSFGTYSYNKKEDTTLLNNLKSKLKAYTNIHYFYLPYSTIYNDEYVYSRDFLDKKMDFKNRYNLDFQARSLLQIYNLTKSNKHRFKNIHNEYIKLLSLIERLLDKDMSC